MPNFKKLQILRFTSALALAALTCSAAPHPGIGKWTPSANLSAARAGSCSAVLADGTVLVTGGSGVNGALASVEMLGARRGSNVGSMLTAREEHICATLAGGAVLVAGGKTSGGGITNSAELFEPQTRTWEAVGPLGTARTGAVSLLLRDGRVLIAGGMSSGAPTGTIEIFDPATNQFSAAAVTMSARRTEHAAATLRDGRVVLAGGFDGANVLDSIDIFDPHTGSLTSGGRLATPRRGLSATALLDGDVLFAGGNDGSKDLASAQLFHSSTGTPGDEIAMDGARANHIAVALPHNNTVLLLGGTASGEPLLDTEVYVPWRRRFEPGTGLGLGRVGATASVLRTPGRLVVIGGRNRDGLLASSEETTFATLSSDKDDYHPGETLTLTGTGWMPGETIEMHMTVDPKTHEDVTLTSVADADGNFTNSDYVVQLSDAGVRFYATSTGLTSGRTAALLTFTDLLTTVTARDAACANTVTSVVYGSTACLYVDLVASGSVTFRLQWYSGSTITGAPQRDTKKTASTGIVTDTYAPGFGTWTLVLCNQSGTGNCPTANQIPAGGVPLNVTQKTLTVTNVTAANKVYNGTTSATLNTGSAALSGVINEDSVTLVKTGAAGTFADKNVGTGKTVTVTGFTISGTDASKYTLQQPAVTANITVKTITVSGITATKTYDGNTTVTFNIAGATFAGVIAGDTVTLNAGTGTYASKNVGASIGITSSGFTLGGADGGNYSLTQPTGLTGSITAKALTVSGITANSKTYDGTTSATLNTGSAALVGVVTGDTVTLNKAGASGAFSTSAAGQGKTVTISGLTISGTSSGNYTLTQPSTTADINAKALAVTGITANAKTYDGTATASLNTASATLSGVVSPDTVTLNTGSAKGTFSDKSVGTGKLVTIAGLTLSGAQAGNYTVTQPSATANITAKPLTVSGVTANNKPYDGAIAATLNTGSAALVGVVPGDTVTLNSPGASATFDTKNVGNNKPVTVTGFTISGTDAGNYSLSQPSGLTANITAKALAVTGVTANGKTYDGIATASLNLGSAALSGVVGSENVTLNKASVSASFADKAAGVNKPVTVAGFTISGADAGNYSIAQPAGLTATISPLNLSISGVTATGKQYDGNNTATLNPGSAALVTVLGGDTVTLNAAGATGTFDTKNVGNNKPVTVTGFTISGTDAGNYTLSQPSGLTANITAKALAVTGVTASSKVYDGNATATLNKGSASLVGIVAPDAVTLNTGSATGAFDNANAGTSKPVTVSGLTLGGTDAGNYSLTQPSPAADITAKTLAVTGITANGKIYDGNTTATINTGGAALSGVLGAENVTLNSAGAAGAFGAKTAGTGKLVNISGLALGGTAAGNYSLTQPTALADITAKGLTISGVTANNKAYDGNTNATLNTGSASLIGVVGGDTVSLNTGSASGTFASKNAATGIAVTASGFTLGGGADASNYSVSQPSGLTASILAKGLTVIGITANNKLYDATTAATINLGGAALMGVVGVENVTLNTGSASGVFDDANVGAGKPVTVMRLTIGGTDSGNYSLTPPTTPAIINSILTVGPRSQLVALTWKAYPGATSYQVCRSDPPGTKPSTNCATTTTVGYSFGALSNCSMYYFQVTPQFPGTIPGAVTPIMSAMPKALLTTCP